MSRRIASRLHGRNQQRRQKTIARVLISHQTRATRCLACSDNQEFTYSIPSTITAPVELKEPPRPGIPLVVVYSRTASKSQMIFPVSTANARKWPSIEGEKTTPGMTVGGARCAMEQPCLPAQEGVGGGVCHINFPVAGSIANNPPPEVGTPRTASANGEITSFTSGLYAIPH